MFPKTQWQAVIHDATQYLRLLPCSSYGVAVGTQVPLALWLHADLDVFLIWFPVVATLRSFPRWLLPFLLHDRHLHTLESRLETWDSGVWEPRVVVTEGPTLPYPGDHTEDQSYPRLSPHNQKDAVSNSRLKSIKPQSPHHHHVSPLLCPHLSITISDSLPRLSSVPLSSSIFSSSPYYLLNSL